MLTPRENLLAVLNHQPAEYIPDFMQDVFFAGATAETFENGPLGGGYDAFGVKWITSDSANGQAVPDPTVPPVIPDVEDWEKYLKLPDLDAFDWKGMAEAQLAGKDRSQKLVVYATWNHIFLRFTHLLGFENALLALAVEPEASMDLMSAICDYKCRLVDYIVEYTHPDIITNYDDVSAIGGPFLSPASYREMIKPFHKKFNDKVRSYGILPSQHCCGNCAALIPDFIDEGSVLWESAQPVNDIVKIQREYGDRIVIAGGYDTQGPAAAPGVTDETIEEEVKRVIREYGPGGSFVMQAFLLSNDTDPMAFMNGVMRIAKYTNKYRYVNS